MPAPQSITVGIIEDLGDVREGLALLINGTQGYRCTGKFASMEDALTAIAKDLPQVALVDIGLPGMSGIDGVRILSQQYPSLQFLMLTVFDDDERILQALCAGACGYLLKKTPPARLLESLKEVVNGGAPMSPEVARRIVTLFRKFAPPETASYGLTVQEKKLLALLGAGHHYKTAAEEMKVSVHTVAFHLRGIYSKLQVHSKSEAVAKALRDGLIQ